MTEKKHESVDNGAAFGGFINLSKVFECLEHKFLIAKLQVSSFYMRSPNLWYDYRNLTLHRLHQTNFQREEWDGQSEEKRTHVNKIY